MSITTRVADRAPPQTTYPRIGLYPKSGKLVLFSGAREGTVLRGDSSHGIGFHSVTWLDADFEPFDGELTLVSRP